MRFLEGFVQLVFLLERLNDAYFIDDGLSAIKVTERTYHRVQGDTPASKANGHSQFYFAFVVENQFNSNTFRAGWSRK